MLLAGHAGSEHPARPKVDNHRLQQQLHAHLWQSSYHPDPRWTAGFCPPQTAVSGEPTIQAFCVVLTPAVLPWQDQPTACGRVHANWSPNAPQLWSAQPRVAASVSRPTAGPAALIFSPPTEPLLLGNGPQQYSDAITYSARRCNGHSRRLRARYFDFSAFTDCLYQDLSNPDPLGSGRLGRPRAVIVTPDFTTAPGEFQGEATLGPHGHCFWVPFSLALGQGGGKVEIFVLHPMVMG